MKETFFSFSKINLGLSIGPKDETTGLHFINSFMARMGGYADEFVVSDDVNEFTYTCDQVIENDIFPRIIKYLEKKYNKPFNYKVECKKGIPMGAGLGSESAAGAMAIELYNDLLKLNLSIYEQRQIASNFGTDIIYCLGYKPAYVSHYGDIIEEIDLPEDRVMIVIIFDDLQFNTKEMYEQFDKYNKIPFTGRLNFFENSFLPICMRNEKFKNYYEKLAAAGLKCYLTGSGPTLYSFPVDMDFNDILRISQEIGFSFTYGMFRDLTFADDNKPENGE